MDDLFSIKKEEQKETEVQRVPKGTLFSFEELLEKLQEHYPEHTLYIGIRKKKAKR